MDINNGFESLENQSISYKLEQNQLEQEVSSILTRTEHTQCSIGIWYLLNSVLDLF